MHGGVAWRACWPELEKYSCKSTPLQGQESLDGAQESIQSWPEKPETAGEAWWGIDHLDRSKGVKWPACPRGEGATEGKWGGLGPEDPI